jgi:predicted transcriptional regulator
MAPLTVGDQEHLVLRTVTAHGRCTVRDVFRAVGEPRGLAYTTIATVLDRLFAKGLVTRELTGKAFTYRATRKVAAAEKGRVRTLLKKLFAPDGPPAVATLVDAVEDLDPALLDELAAEVDRRRSRRGS